MIELAEHPKKAEWMKKAFTYYRGKTEGEFMLKRNPNFISTQKKEMDELNGLYK